jgi:histidine triad (HIT) family protein
MDAGGAMTCPFCAIVAKSEPAEIVYESATTLAFFPKEGTTKGHTLVIPKDHVPNFLELHPDQWHELGDTIHTISRALDVVVEPDGMNLITSAGEAATQTIMHVHFHVVPRWQHDGFGDLWPNQNLSTQPERDAVAEALRSTLGKRALVERNPQ